MASVAKTVLTTAQAFTGNGTTTAVSLGPKTDKFLLFLNVTAIGAGTSLVVTLQHSPNGSDFFAVVPSSAFTATGVQSLSQQSFTVAGSGLYPWVRLSLVFTGGTTTATITGELYYDSTKG